MRKIEKFVNRDDLKSINNSNESQITEFPKFEGTTLEKVNEFLNHISFEMDSFENNILIAKKNFNLSEFENFYKLIVFNFETKEVSFGIEYDNILIYKEEMVEFEKWSTLELKQIAYDLIKS